MLENQEKYGFPYQLLKFNQDKDDINTLLYHANGWDNYMELTEEQYNELIKSK